MLGVRSGAVRLGRVLGERDGEESEQVAVGGLDISESLDGGLSLLDHGA